MSLYKKGKNWYIDYYYPPGRAGNRIREKIGPVKDEARIMLAKRLEDIRQGRNPELRKVSPTLFKAHARKCLAEHYGKKRCEAWARLVIERHLIPWFGKRLLGEMTPKLVSEYMTGRLADGVANIGGLLFSGDRHGYQVALDLGTLLVVGQLLQLVEVRALVQLCALDLAEHIGWNAVGAGEGEISGPLGSAGFVFSILGELFWLPGSGISGQTLPSILPLLPQLLPPFDVQGQFRRTEIGAD